MLKSEFLSHISIHCICRNSIPVHQHSFQTGFRFNSIHNSLIRRIGVAFKPVCFHNLEIGRVELICMTYNAVLFQVKIKIKPSFLQAIYSLRYSIIGYHILYLDCKSILIPKITQHRVKD